MTRQRIVAFAVLLAAALLFLTAFSDRDGYEGDDLNSILPMIHLDEAKHGDLLIYKYHWQPLAYELGAAVYRLTNKPDTIFLLAPIAGAIAMALLFLLTCRKLSSVAELINASVALLAVPELWFSGLYFNSTILALPFAVTSLLVLRWTPPGSAVWSGVLLGIAALLRLDFILAAPIFLLMAWETTGKAKAALWFCFSLAALMLLAYVAGILDPREIAEIYRSSAKEIAEKSQAPGWDLRAKLGTISIMFSPLGWIILVVGGPLVLIESFRRDPKLFLARVAALMPLLLPIPNLLSAKYAIPLLMFAPGFLTMSLSRIETRLQPRLGNVPVAMGSLVSIGLIFVSVSLLGKPPYLVFGTLASRQIGTHDGPRSYGGYFWQIREIRFGDERTDNQSCASRILKDFLDNRPKRLLVVGDEGFFDPGGAGWRDLQLELEDMGVHGKLTAPHRIAFARDGAELVLTRDLPTDIDKLFDNAVGEIKVYDRRASAMTNDQSDTRPEDGRTKTYSCDFNFLDAGQRRPEQAPGRQPVPD